MGSGNVMPVWESLGSTCFIVCVQGQTGLGIPDSVWNGEMTVCVLPTPLGWCHRKPDSKYDT